MALTFMNDVPSAVSQDTVEWDQATPVQSHALIHSVIHCTAFIGADLLCLVSQKLVFSKLCQAHISSIVVVRKIDEVIGFQWSNHTETMKK